MKGGIYCKYVGHNEATNEIHVWKKGRGGGAEKKKQNCTNIGQKQKNTWFKTFLLKLPSSKYVYCLFFPFYYLKPLS